MARHVTLETFLLLVLAGFSGLFLLASRDYGTTAALFPGVIASAALAFIALDVVSGALFSRKAKAPAEASNMGWVAPLALQGGYIALIYLAGFAAATLVYLLVCPWQLRYRNRLVTVLHAVLFTFAIVYVFHVVFHVRLPKGLLGIPF